MYGQEDNEKGKLRRTYPCKSTSIGLELTLPVQRESANSYCYLSPKTPGAGKGTLASYQCEEAEVTEGDILFS